MGTMREVLDESRASYVYGAWSAHGDSEGGVVVYTAAPLDVTGGLPSRRPPPLAPPERSGLAHAAGFAGVLYLFRYSFAPLVFAQAGTEWTLAVWMMFVWGLLSPAALALSFGAAVSLDRSPRKSGRLPALFGFAVGWLGIAMWLARLDERWLLSLSMF